VLRHCLVSSLRRPFLNSATLLFLRGSRQEKRADWKWTNQRRARSRWLMEHSTEEAGRKMCRRLVKVSDRGREADRKTAISRPPHTTRRLKSRPRRPLCSFNFFSLHPPLPSPWSVFPLLRRPTTQQTRRDYWPGISFSIYLQWPVSYLNLSMTVVVSSSSCSK
jgi:hypothetical protein